ncbi:hypothetical protein AJ87_36275 [Rhizobium yanglingense]|nr:hypothetical protein AJ87_36275 [Rhizobium yanglingense]
MRQGSLSDEHAGATRHALLELPLDRFPGVRTLVQVDGISIAAKLPWAEMTGGGLSAGGIIQGK